MTNRRTVLLHTSSKIIPSIESRFSSYWRQLNVQHFVDESMLELLQNEGFASNAATDMLTAHLSSLERYAPDNVICTCTTLSPTIRAIRDRFSMPITTVDEHMIAELRQSCKNPLLVLTSPTTKEASLKEFAELFSDAHIRHIFVDGALDACLAGDIVTHNEILSVAIAAEPKGYDAVVLPQSSMIVALDTLRSAIRVPVFNGLESAVPQLTQQM